MRWVIKQSDLDTIKEQYGEEMSIVGYADEYKLFAIPIPKMYVVLMDSQKIQLIQLTMNMDVKQVETISIADIQEVKVSGAVIKKVVITTNSGKIKLSVKPHAVGIQASQKALLKALHSL
ncbi:hypothetical protein IV487_11305 [Enterococcus saccharolyticus]|uniref:YokE-like PH domain-containing protein n=1 Tax=Candidatus Enterococcus willemsii TaxID=1857215 RepID=A0ABQ6Z2V2_9ENTE|nr:MULTISPECIES: hypothetical protein [Enterococcus]KAF1305856.1 hypothetical protein BAU17_13090 [Enterococcus sp. CU12B]MCD5003051.1 hypothetical protein [Enterococcus saccharolyticus]